MITLKFANGALGVIDNSRRAVYGYDQRLEIFGDKGSAQVFNNSETTVEMSTAEHVEKEKPFYFFLERYTQSYINELKDFVSSCLENNNICCSGYDGLKSEQIAKQAKQSLETGIPVQLPHLDHPQATAPGYAMYFCWMIRHLNENPWTTRIIEEEHKWLLNFRSFPGSFWPEQFVKVVQVTKAFFLPDC